jgi:hypothetical protein
MSIHYNQWNPWTARSIDVPYNKRRPGVGKGEFRLSAELDVTLLGQNSPYDFEYRTQKCDAKELDNTTFNSGVLGRHAYMHVLQKLRDAIRAFKMLENFMHTNDKTRYAELEKYLSIIDMDVGEVCESKLCGNKKWSNGLIYDMLTYMYNYYQYIVQELPVTYYHQPRTGEIVSRKLNIVVNALISEGECVEELIEEFGMQNVEICILIKSLECDYIKCPDQFVQDIQKLISIFDDYVLFFVHPVKGFYPLTNPCAHIRTQRITRCTPRFALIRNI